LFNRFHNRLDALGQINVIIETGFSEDVLDLAEYIELSGGVLSSVDLDINSLNALHKKLEDEHLAPFASLHLQEPVRFLLNKTWIDVAFLNHRGGLAAGLEQAKLAMSAGARLIVMTRYQSEAAWAVAFVKKQGWAVEHEGDYSFLTRP
jgi:hypothetical protein